MNVTGLSVVVPPYAEPITLVEMKNHLKVELGVTDDDALIAAQITAARDYVETGTSANSTRMITMVATTFDLALHAFPACIELPRRPLVAVSSITYLDDAGETQTLDADTYVVDYARGNITLAYSAVWPTTRYQANAVTVRFIAGLVAPFTTSGDTLAIQGRSFTVGDRVRLANSGGQLPTGLATQTDYFVIASSQLSLTAGGAAVDITTTGSGTHFIGLNLTPFEALRAAIKLAVGHWYQNREAVVFGSAPMAMPIAVEALIYAGHA